MPDRIFSSITPAWDLRRRPVRVALALLAVLALLTGVFNVRSAFGGGGERGWVADPAALSAVDALVGASARPASQLDAQILSLQEALRANGDNGPAATLLGQAYLQKTRETGDPGYYPKAEALFRRALQANDQDFAAMVGMGTLDLARHRFADALEWGERAHAANPYHAPALGVIGDAQVELGRYDDAVQTVQAMVNLRPDLASYARVSYLRELMGDRSGAVAAMEQAVTAGASRPENVAWTQVQLGNLLFDSGDLDGAERAYAQASAGLPGYVYAVAGQGRVAAACGDLSRAADLYATAIQTTPVAEFVIARGDILAAAGRADEAATQYALVGAIQRLYAANGVDVDLELALYTADHGRPADLPDAVARVRAQVARRPSVTAYDALAWTLYRSGDFAGARAAAHQALHLGTKSALMDFHAGMIEAALGNHDEAISQLQSALDLNPSFSVRFAPEARATLAALRAATALQEAPR